MGKFAILAIVFLFLISDVLVGQTSEKKISPKIDPFKISRGKLFSASTSRSNRHNSKKLKRTTIQSVSANFDEALEIIRQNHFNGTEINQNELTKASITSMLRTLDPHSNYFDPSEFSELLSEQHSEYFGIGATITNFKKNKRFRTYVTSTSPNSPAFHAGLRFGDKIVAISNKRVLGKSSLFIRNKIRGPKNSTVRVTVERADTKQIETLLIKRTRIFTAINSRFIYIAFRNRLY